MKKFTLILFSLVLMFSCNTSKHYMKKGQYDLATKHAVKKLVKNPKKAKEILILEEAFPKANLQNEERINYLHSEGKPDRWDEIYKTYAVMRDRQTIVERVTPLVVEGRTVKFEHVDYDLLIKDAKTKAAAYYYAHGVKLMAENYKVSYRQAYDEFNRAKEYSNLYKDIDSLLPICREKGTIHALLIAVNNTSIKLPDMFLINILEQNTTFINSFWVVYHVKNDGTTFDYNVNIKLNNIQVSPDAISERSYTESTNIKDGWEYVMDDKGNVKKDSLGNDMKVEKYSTISCTVIETRQFKDATATGEVEYLELASNEVLLLRDFKADQHFENYFAIASGNPAALSSESKVKVLQKIIPYPKDYEMIDGLNGTLKTVIGTLLKDNAENLLMNY